MRVKIPDAFAFLFDATARFLVAYGGRDSGKSTSVIIVLLILGMQNKHKILCCREIQKSIKKSVHASLVEWIKELNIEYFYTVTDNSIKGINGTEFIFEGLHQNVESIKSINNITICYVEEANTISQRSWDVLIPTIREEGSKFFIVFNPELPTDPVWKMFVENQVADSIVKMVNCDQNPFQSKDSKNYMNYLKEHDYKKYEHVYLGKLLDQSESSVFNNFSVGPTIKPQDGQYLFGLDFGFASDPNALVKLSVDLNNRILYIHEEAYGHRIELDNLPDFMDLVSGTKDNYIVADNSRPETISFLQKRNYYILPSKKGKDSIYEGIEFIKNFKIIIHPTCMNTLYEFAHYSHEVDKLTGLIKPKKFVDKDNHIIDAIRYALELIRNNNTIDFEFITY